MAVLLKEVDEMVECPCGIVTNQAIVWEFSGFNHKQPLCRTCQKELKENNRYV